ncbi:hypothetical protein EOE67_06665 [Rheinheimera riviphila]|uniref:Ice-binding protein C-terminal domain-containing protein n=1 Tax=Rheinheimera riviphila TaxID=1834037 RepID=A0A437R0H9_9GAMM|nr:PEP-CTERM sorting domain-containing protein [Rheinheimera riviphila]RVU40272.1 hypothetical protein EOE67_06665 [Rheinheimera riviphila]
MLRKFFVLAGLLLASVSTPAAVIEYKGYSRDSSSNIVTGGGLEWLKWDVTQGMSINEALAAHKGWSLASNLQMASLFNAFQFGASNWHDKENMIQYSDIDWSQDELGDTNAFIDLFGFTSGPWKVCMTPADKNCDIKEDARFYTAAHYGIDNNANGYYNHAYIEDDSSSRYSSMFDVEQIDGFALLMSDLFLNVDRDDRSLSFGIALVRIHHATPSPVSLPGSLSLLALGLAGLAYRRRKGATVNLCGQAA